MKRILTLLSICVSASCFAQHTSDSRSKQSLALYEDSLQHFGFKMINDTAESARYDASYTMIKTLVNALKTPRSYYYNFDSLKTISIQRSPDTRFRIFSWHVTNDDGSYRFYGTIQMNDPNGKLVMYPLVDHTFEIKKPADTVTTNEKWYGAQYYKIIPVTSDVAYPYYILLGWKGNTARSTKKVIDILYFKNNKAYFGMPVFEDKNNPGNKRMIFEYARYASMHLNYIQKDQMIVFDHLSAPDAKMKGNFETYGPDMSYDGYKIIHGKLRLVEDLELKNAPTDIDSEYNDPRKPKPGQKREFY